jgi:hypothetical protein
MKASIAKPNRYEPQCKPHRHEEMSEKGGGLDRYGEVIWVERAESTILSITRRIGT